MTSRYAIIFVCAVALLSGCDESVQIVYATRADAEAKSLFERGWLPNIIPTSSRQIAVKNNLDLNISEGEFKFDASDHDDFIDRLERTQSRDIDGCSAYSFEDWTFWISNSRNHCRFSTKFTRK